MEIDEFRSYCLQKKGVEECFPFDEDTLVFKVMGKMFALTSLSTIPFSVNVKCDPEQAIVLRERYPDVIPGYHMDKKHWNTILVGHRSIPDSLLHTWIDDSYNLVVKGLPKKLKQALADI